MVTDPIADPAATKREYDIELSAMEACKNAQCVVFAVAHEQYKQMTSAEIEQMFNQDLPNDQRILIDVKGVLDKMYFEDLGYRFWRL